jgi:DNA-binding NtrC family response regulator
MALHILIADPGAESAEKLREQLEAGGCRVTVTPRGDEALATVREGEVDALVTETGLTGELGGRELIDRLLTEMPAFPVFVRTAHGQVDEAFRLAQRGVRAYMLASDPLPEVSVRIIAGASGEPEPDSEERAPYAADVPYTQYVSRNAETRGIFRTAIERVAQAPSTVLITGESGTGKELLARTIHRHSPRAEGAWVAVNAAALPENLIESELFGHEKGAFTGATGKRIGRFEQASGGTFFLDEVGDLSPVIQTKLLRVLQERVFERVGGNEPVRVDVRVIAATHRNLRALVKRGEFREDLYYRLAVINLELPPLRERPEDIPGLALFFLERFRRESGREPMQITPAAIRAMKGYKWPGNVRELENVIERAVVMSLGNRVDVDDLPDEIRRSRPLQDQQTGLRQAREEFEREFIERALVRNEGNVSATSTELGLARKNLQEKIKRYEIEIDEIREQGSGREAAGSPRQD